MLDYGPTRASEQAQEVCKAVSKLLEDLRYVLDAVNDYSVYAALVEVDAEVFPRATYRQVDSQTWKRLATDLDLLHAALTRLRGLELDELIERTHDLHQEATTVLTQADH